MENEQSQESSANASIAGCLIPAFWMLGGNGIIAVLRRRDCQSEHRDYRYCGRLLLANSRWPDWLQDTPIFDISVVEQRRVPPQRWPTGNDMPSSCLLYPRLCGSRHI